MFGLKWDLKALLEYQQRPKHSLVTLLLLLLPALVVPLRAGLMFGLILDLKLLLAHHQKATAISCKTFAAAAVAAHGAAAAAAAAADAADDTAAAAAAAQRPLSHNSMTLAVDTFLHIETHESSDTIFVRVILNERDKGTKTKATKANSHARER